MAKTAFNTPTLRDINSFTGAEYNPRKMVPERLTQMMVSLSKLGFILPIYVNKNGTILSGHQRTTAAKLYGYTKIPVVELDVPDSSEKGMNVIFNKGTNDLDTYSSNAKLAFSEYLEKAGGLTQELPDIPPDTIYPCLETRSLCIKDALRMAGKDVPETLRSSGYALVENHIYMPIVCCGDRILNGKGRVYGYADKNWDSVECIDIPEEKADYAYLALNFLAMDFDIQANFKEELRFNAFRRKAVQAPIVGLSRTFTFFVYDRVVSNTLNRNADITGAENPDLLLLPTASEESRKKFQDKLGKVIFDMGAGTLHDTGIMRAAGFDCTAFEPFYCGEGTTPNVEASRKLADALLDKLDSLVGVGPDSLISSFVMNSIPHHQDRMAYLTILAAMSKMKTTLYLGTQHVAQINSNLVAHLRLNSEEPNVTLGNDARFFKAQKFYQTEELEKILKVFFATVTLRVSSGNIFAECRHPRRVPNRLLRDSLELEFNMPYSGGERMNLHEKAIEVFSRYVGRDLRTD